MQDYWIDSIRAVLLFFEPCYFDIFQSCILHRPSLLVVTKQLHGDGDSRGDGNRCSVTPARDENEMRKEIRGILLLYCATNGKTGIR